ncbi:MAG: hypothetical protein LBQ58_11890, partial [Synergistaceae bacterium]|nr:hypothetical protein [Synergistaceae bacterium]
MFANERNRIKRITAAFALALFVSQTSLPLAGVARSDAADIGARAVPKGDFGWSEVDLAVKKPRKPNVLFYIDNSINMTLEPTGVLPAVVPYAYYNDNSDHEYADWDKTALPVGGGGYGLTQDDVINMVRKATFGYGALPVVDHKQNFNWNPGGLWKNNENGNQYGRDSDDSNNFKKGDTLADLKDRYYFPHAFSGDAIRKAFAAQTTRLDGAGNNSTPAIYDPYPKTGDTGAYPYALVFRNPKYWKTGWTEDTDPTSMDLVPNDSRMYQLKNALWRLFVESDTGVFEDIRFGLAKNFQETVYHTATGGDGAIRNWPLTNAQGDHVAIKTKKPGYTSPLENKVYEYGALGHGVTGEHKLYSTYAYGVQTHTGWIIRPNYNPLTPTPTGTEYTKEQKQHFRGHLLIPMEEGSYQWTKGAISVRHKDRFGVWIDGINDVANMSKDNTSFTNHANPEIVPIGQYQLANAIFPDPTPIRNMNREWQINNKNIWYGYNRSRTGNAFGGEYMTYFMNGSGEAAGSVVDFFSPPTSGVVSIPKAEIDDLNFAIRDVCTDNWLVLFTHGQEIEAIDNSDAKKPYLIRDAIKNLHDYTASNDVTVADIRNGARTLSEGRLQNPIRTIVVGIVGDPKDFTPGTAEYNAVVKQRENLELMAKAGQPDNPDAKAYYAQDTEELIKSIEELIAYIVSQQTELGTNPTIVAPSFQDDESVNLYSSSYGAVYNDQWIGRLSRFQVVTSPDGDIISVVRKWEFNDKLQQQRGQRKMYYWSNSDGGKFIPFNEVNLETFASLTGINDIPASTLPGETYGSVPPSEAFYSWFQGYDHFYDGTDGGQQFPRAAMMSDFGQSSLVMVNDPASADYNPLPGYDVWAAGFNQVTPNQPMMYTQTNDGVMHVIHPETGSEVKGILPPPVMMPHRLATLKTQVLGDNLHWINVDGEKNVSLKMRSNPVYLLDGTLQKREMDISGWHKYLIGAMGRAGNGIFLYNVDEHDNPKLVWYKEKMPNGLISMNAGHANASEALVANYNSDSNLAPYNKLGLNSPKPGVGVAWKTHDHEETRNFIALAGGIQSTTFASDDNGKEGAVLLLIDPKDGSLITHFDSATVGASNTKAGGGITGAAPYMGMMTSPPTLIRTDVASPYRSYVTGRLFAADNRGNIFRVGLTLPSNPISQPDPKNDWEIDTVATLQESSSAAASSTNSYATPYQFAAAFSGTNLWIAGGTADVPVRNPGGDGESMLVNSKQFIYSFMPEANNMEAVQYRTESWKKLVVSSDIIDDTNLTLTVADAKSGWYIELWRPPSDSYSGKRPEYVTTAPVLAGDTLLVSTFIQDDVIGANDPTLCGSRNISGTTHLYAVSITSGAANLWASGGKYVEIKNIKITDIIVVKNESGYSVFAVYDKLSGDTNFDVDANLQHTEQDGLAMFSIPIDQGNTSTNLEPNQNVIMYWMNNSANV